MGLVLVFVALLVLGRAAQNDSSTAEGPAPSGQQAEVAPSEAAVPVSLTATDLQKAYSANAVSAKQKYEGKLALVTGRIENISIMMGKPHVSLRTGEMFTTVTCVFPEEASDTIAQLAKEDRITVKGVVGGEPIGMGVFIENCELVK